MTEMLEYVQEDLDTQNYRSLLYGKAQDTSITLCIHPANPTDSFSLGGKNPPRSVALATASQLKALAETCKPT